jgi:hypothetical protein
MRSETFSIPRNDAGGGAIEGEALSSLAALDGTQRKEGASFDAPSFLFRR